MLLRKEEKWKLLLFLIPAIVLFVALFLYPLIYVIAMSFYEWDAFTKPVFAGFQNYVEIFTDRVFKTAIKNNLLWSTLDVCVKVPMALMMALILSRKFLGWKFFRTVYFLPQVISGVAMAALWSAVFAMDFGMLNGLLRIFGYEGNNINWLGNVNTALICVVGYGLLYVGYFMVIMLAEITGIDNTYYEAASLDGANALQVDWHVTIPMIRSSIMTCVTLAAVFGLRAFEQVYLLTEGGPANRTMTMVMYLYKKMNSNVYGEGNAAAVILVILGITVMVTVRKIFAERD